MRIKGEENKIAFLGGKKTTIDDVVVFIYYTLFSVLVNRRAVDLDFSFPDGKESEFCSKLEKELGRLKESIRDLNLRRRP